MRYRIPFGEMPWDTPMPGVRCKISRQGARQIRLVEYTGQMEQHWCEKAHLGYVLQGEIEIEFPGGSERYSAGDGVSIPAGHEHRHKAKVLSERVTVVFVEDV